LLLGSSRETKQEKAFAFGITSINNKVKANPPLLYKYKQKAQSSKKKSSINYSIHSWKMINGSWWMKKIGLFGMIHETFLIKQALMSNM
jgi:hypothetical protein